MAGARHMQGVAREGDGGEDRGVHGMAHPRNLERVPRVGQGLGRRVGHGEAREGGGDGNDSGDSVGVFGESGRAHGGRGPCGTFGPDKTRARMSARANGAGRGAWRTAVEVEEGLAEPFWAALEGFGDSVAAVRVPGGTMRVEAFGGSPPDRARLEIVLALISASLGIAAPVPCIEELGPRDWLAENRLSFPPLAVGRFLVHAVGDRPTLSHGVIALALDAGMAFGSGRHASTQLCLHGFDGLARAGVRVRRALDLGCGSAILAIAMAKLWRARVIASDEDPAALAVAAENAALNFARLRLRAARGFGHPDLGAGGPYDLVVANILFRPLLALAPAIARHVRPGGHAVLSGLLVREERGVVRAYEAAGLRTVRRMRHEGWLGLVLRRDAIGRDAIRRGPARLGEADGDRTQARREELPPRRRAVSMSSV